MFETWVYKITYRYDKKGCAFVVIKENTIITKVLIWHRELQCPFKLSGYGNKSTWFWFHYSDFIIGAMASKNRRFDCLFNRLFRRRAKKTPKLRVTGLCEGNSPVTSEFPAQRASNVETVSTCWRHHVYVNQIAGSLIRSPPKLFIFWAATIAILSHASGTTSGKDVATKQRENASVWSGL